MAGGGHRRPLGAGGRDDHVAVSVAAVEGEVVVRAGAFLVTQLGLILGFPVAGVTGSPWGMIGTFMGLRAVADASIAWLQGLMKRRDLPPGLARFLARRGKQSVETLEAEFDALSGAWWPVFDVARLCATIRIAPVTSSSTVSNQNSSRSVAGERPW